MNEKEHSSPELAVSVKIVSGRSINPDMMLRVFRRGWTLAGGLELKILDQSSFVFYFEDASDMAEV